MRRLALLSLTAASVLATAAFAQETIPATPAVPAAPEAAPAVPAVPATPAAPAAAAPQAAPTEAGVAPVLPAPEAPPAPPAPPPAPTDVTSVAILGAVSRVCEPLVAGGDLTQLAPAAGFKKKRDQWVWQYAKGYQITVLPQGTNPGVCTLQVTHPIDGLTPVIVDLHNWAMAKQWTLYRNDKYVTDQERSTRSWELRGQNQTEALVLLSVRKADGTPLARNSDYSEVLYTVQKY
ncbi:MAG: hypothetical protein V4466_10170 [Pseudomonadota bacterium]